MKDLISELQWKELRDRWQQQMSRMGPNSGDDHWVNLFRLTGDLFSIYKQQNAHEDMVFVIRSVLELENSKIRKQDLYHLQLALAEALIDLSRFPEAKIKLNEIISTPPDDISPALLAEYKSKYAYVLLTLGDVIAAKKFIDESLDVLDNPSGVPGLLLGAALNIGSVIYSALNDLDKAMDLGNRALKNDEIIFGPLHMRIATKKANLGGIYSKKGDTKKAVQLVEEALAIDLYLYGPISDKVSLRYASLAEIYLAAGDLDKAKDYAETSLNISRRVHGNAHLQHLNSFILLIDISIRSGNKEEAVLSIKEADSLINSIGLSAESEFAKALEDFRNKL